MKKNIEELNFENIESIVSERMRKPHESLCDAFEYGDTAKYNIDDNCHELEDRHFAFSALDLSVEMSNKSYEDVEKSIAEKIEESIYEDIDFSLAERNQNTVCFVDCKVYLDNVPNLDGEMIEFIVVRYQAKY